jgi:hypothetical protein
MRSYMSPNIKDLEAVKDAVKLWSTSLRKELRVYNYRSSMYDIKCVHEGCPWRVHVIKGRWKTHWTCLIIMEHNYSSEVVAKTHRNMTFAVIASEMYGLIVDNINYEQKVHLADLQIQYKLYQGIEGEAESVWD